MTNTTAADRVERILAEDGIPLLVPKSQAADLLHLHPRSLERYIAKGRLQAFHTDPAGSGRVLIARASLAALLVDMGAAGTSSTSGDTDGL